MRQVQAKNADNIIRQNKLANKKFSYQLIQKGIIFHEKKLTLSSSLTDFDLHKHRKKLRNANHLTVFLSKKSAGNKLKLIVTENMKLS